MALYLGIDVGCTTTKIGIVDDEGKILKSGSFPTDKTPEGLVQKIAEWAKAENNLTTARQEQLAAAGAGVPAPLDPKRETIIFAPNLGWRNVRFRKMLEDAIGVPAVIENDANLAAYGEYCCGAAAGYRSCALLTLGTGVGGGIVIGGKLLIGDTGFAAELGHITVNAEGPRCGCGNSGCLEAYASAKALGIAIACIAHTVNPSAVILSGGISSAGPAFFDKVSSEARSRMFEQCKLDIVPGKLGATAGMIGAALWAKEKLGS